MLFVSVIMLPEFLKLTNNFMRDPITILVKKDESNLEAIDQYYIPIEKENHKFFILTDFI